MHPDVIEIHCLNCIDSVHVADVEKRTHAFLSALDGKAQAGRMSLSVCYKKPTRVQGFSAILFFPYIIKNEHRIWTKLSLRERTPILQQ